MDVITTTVIVVLGLLLGAVGQGARSIVGIKKQFDLAAQSDTNSEFKDWFNIQLLIVTLAIGAIAGGLASLLIMGKDLNTELLLGLVAAGYAGTDFIEGFMKTEASKITDLSQKTRATIAQQVQEDDSKLISKVKVQVTSENEIKKTLYSVGKIADEDRRKLAQMDEEATRAEERIMKRHAMRKEWIIKGISVPGSEAEKLYLIDGFNDDHDIQRVEQLHKERAVIIEKYKNI